MSGSWISAVTIPGVAAVGCLLALKAGGQSASKSASAVVEQISYFALPGKAEDTLEKKHERISL